MTVAPAGQGEQAARNQLLVRRDDMVARDRERDRNRAVVVDGNPDRTSGMHAARWTRLSVQVFAILSLS
jgi:hypothetical protein